MFSDLIVLSVEFRQSQILFSGKIGGAAAPFQLPDLLFQPAVCLPLSVVLPRLRIFVFNGNTHHIGYACFPLVGGFPFLRGHAVAAPGYSQGKSK